MGTFLLGAAIGLFFGWAYAHKHIAALHERLGESTKVKISFSNL